MASILHILNGDATFYGFNQTGLEGDVLVWREVLSEGPLRTDISAAGFWKERMAWISREFGPTPENYQENTLNPLEMLNKPYQEINLWFEFDLHCQVNMLGVMMLLMQQANLSEPDIYLICPAEVPGVEDFRGMGQLNGSQLESLFDSRLHLNDWEFTLAEQAWNLYISANAVHLKTWLETTPFWGNLPHLKPALEAHLKRLTPNALGLDYIEQKLLDIYNSGIIDQKEVYASFWKTEKIYGMGDAEINLYLKRLNEKGLINLFKHDKNLPG